MAEIFRTKSKDGTEIGCLKSGSGPPLLLVHGAMTDHQSWSAVIPLLEEHFTVYAMDRRGRGESGDAPDYDLQREAEDVAAVVEAIGGPVHVTGHSYGGLCCLEGALLTDNISRLILYEPAIPTDVHFISVDIPERMQTYIDQGDPEAALEVMMREVAGMPREELQNFRKTKLWEKRVSLAGTIPRELKVDQTYQFRPERFESLHTPTLILEGEHSRRNFREANEMVSAALPDSRVVVLPGQEHLAHHTNPQLFSTEALNFLQD